MRRHVSARRDTGARLTRCACAAAALLACAPGLARAAALDPPRPSACSAAADPVRAGSAPAIRAALHCVLDAERARRGLGPMPHDDRLARAARRHARDMVRRGYFGHERPGSTLPSRLRAAGWSGTRAAEAIAWGCGGRGSARATLRAWLRSPPHRAIVLGPYDRAGIGLAVGAPARRCPGGATWVLDAAG